MIQPPIKRCYEILTSNATSPIRGYECYNYMKDKKKNDVESQYCPFNIDSGEFAWVNEAD
jgi:hypothetical protein